MRRHFAQWLMMAWMTAACTACVIGEGSQRQPGLDEREREHEADRCVVAATSGGNGGRGGLLTIVTKSGVALDGAVDVAGGTPGGAGTFEDGPGAEPGSAGEPGLVDFSTDADMQFDATEIPPGSLISVGVDGVENILTVGGSETEPTIFVERLELGPGATLAISRIGLIVAETLVIGEGARLLLRDTGAASMVIDPESIAADSGASGGSARIIARDMIVEGTFDASGGPGPDSADGHHGGQLRIDAETLTVGALGGITLAGGAGGDGIDEQDCSTTPL